ncbi:hypothetical protein [Neorhizobium sp. JUb45]|nr:hypothetical protein [Neorhizobium sp. JUb45]
MTSFTDPGCWRMLAYQTNPDQMGQIVGNAAGGQKQLVHTRWGLPVDCH